MLDLFKNNSNVLHINSNKLLSPELSQSVRIRKRNKLYENVNKYKINQLHV